MSSKHLKNLQKMSRDTLANPPPPPPYVTFGDIFVNPPLSPKVSRII
jgi:hypothetical protein